VEARWFGSSEESIAIPNVASVQIETGVMFSDIRIDSTGRQQSDPPCHGHTKGWTRGASAT
jgi:hypothetical protein